jgi:hypothetical protein
MQTAWRCPKCGKANPKTSIDCEYCGNPSLFSGFAKALAKAVDWQDVTLGTANGQDVKLAADERIKGTVIIGGNGTGKTNILEHLAIADLQANTTAIVFDPHGEIGERLLRIGGTIAEDRIVFCEITGNLSYGFNPLEVQDPNDPLEVSRTVDSLLQVFRKHWSSNTAYAFGSRVEWVLSNTARTIIANPGYTMAEIPLLLQDRNFRDKLTDNVDNPQVQAFWREIRQLDKTTRPKDLWDLVESTTTRLSQFLANEWLYRVLYQAKGTIKFHELINSGKLIIFSLPIGRLGEEPASLLGSLLLGKLVTTIFNRLEYGSTPTRLHIYIDEFSRFSTPLVSSALFTQSRKFNVGTTITLQTLSQVGDEESRTAILQVGNFLCFKQIGEDARTLAAQMPLPDPVALMKPEPILLYSQTPVEDIWEKGHPNPMVKKIREYYFYPVGDLKRLPHDEYWWLDPTLGLLAEHPTWKLFTDWDMYRSSAAMLKQGISIVNTYFYDWMSHKYTLTQPATQEEVQRIWQIVECMTGYMGLRPIMQPYIPEENRKYLLQRVQEQNDYLLQKHHLSDEPGKWGNPPDSRVKALKELEKLKNMPSDIFPADVQAVKEFIMSNRLSAYEADKLIQWKIRPYDPLEVEWLKKLIQQSLLDPRRPTDFQEAVDSYGLIMDIFSFYWLFRKEWRLLSEAEKDRYRQNEYKIIQERTNWQIGQIVTFIKSLRMGGSILEKEPVHTPSHSYRDVELNRRTYNDLRDELATKLVSLPRYQAICALADHSDELPTQVKTILPLQVPQGSDTTAKRVRERCQKQLGHPWKEVYDQMQTRQGLKPPKPAI